MGNKLRSPQEHLSSQIIPLLRDTIANRPIPAAVKTVDSLVTSVEALREQMEVLTRQRGFIDDSAVAVSELLVVLDPIIVALDKLDVIVELLATVNREVVTLNGNTGVYNDGDTIDNYITEIISNDPDVEITGNSTTGEIIIGIGGFYSLFAYLEYTGAIKGDYYGARINSNGIIYYLGTQAWDVKAPRMVNSVSAVVLLDAGDVITMEMFAPDSAATAVSASFGAHLLL